MMSPDTDASQLLCQDKINQKDINVKTGNILGTSSGWSIYFPSSLKSTSFIPIEETKRK